LDPQTGPVQRLAWQLRKLRDGAGRPSYRRLAVQAHYSSTTLASAAKGERLPSLEVTLAYAVACGGDRAEWESRWRATAAELGAAGARAEPAAEPADVQCPYLGPAAYQHTDADRFFGREQVVEQIVGRLADRRFVAVFGASGSGKSSLLRAGLVPALQRGGPHRRVVVLTPGQSPLSECAVRVARVLDLAAGSLLAELTADVRNLGLAVRQALAEEPAEAELIMIVDQFEEVFTDLGDERHREQFIRTLLAAAHPDGGRIRVVLGVRADFHARCADYPELVQALQDAQFRIGGMSPDELTRAIMEPAHRAGLMVERTLVTTILNDTGGQPGHLPFMSQALLDAWHRRRGNAMTLTGYHEAGGVRGAVAQSAERVYHELDGNGQAVARDIFLRLTAYGDGAVDTRRSVARSELGHDPDVSAVLHRLAAARLLTLDEDTVEMAHEALIRCWPTLRGWLAEDREALLAHRHLTVTALEWRDGGFQDDVLYRGARLAAWDDRPIDRCNELELGFLTNGWELRDRGFAACRRRLRRGLAALVLTVLLVSFLAVTTRTAANQVKDARDMAYAGQLAAEARRQLTLDPELALLLSIRAYETAPTSAAEAVLKQATVASRRRATVPAGHGGAVNGVAFSPDGGWLASSGRDGAVRVWARADWALQGPPVTVLRGHQGPAWSVAFSPDGQQLASAGEDGTVRVRDWRTTREVVLRGHVGPVLGAAFSPDGRRLASGGADGTVRIWDLASRSAVVLRGDLSKVQGVAFSADGKHLAAAHADGVVRVWSSDGQSPQRRLTGDGAPARSVAFSPDGHWLASSGEDGTVRVWDMTTAQDDAQILHGHAGAVDAVVFSPDSRNLATCGEDGTIRIWNTGSTVNPLTLRGHRGAVTGAAFDPRGGHELASAGADGTLGLWDTSGYGDPLMLNGHRGRVSPVDFSRDGTHVASGGQDGTVEIWDTGRLDDTVVLNGPGGAITDVAFGPDGRQTVAGTSDGAVRIWRSVGDPTPRTLHGHDGAVWTVAAGPDGRRVASGGQDGTVRIWNTTGDQEPMVLLGHDRDVNTVAFSPDGQLLASGGDDGTVRLWDTTGVRRPVILRGHDGGVRSVAFSPDGQRLASGDDDGTVRIWNTAGDGSEVLRGHEGQAWSVAFSPDGRHIASSGIDGTVRVWSTTTDEPVVIDGFGASVGEVVFARDGRHLATGHGDGTTRVWRCDACLDVQDALALARSRVTRDFTAEERTAFLRQAS
jgi:WD40 repeat protein/energy-coupling factor transporter ATP-binding protein EcfA2